MDSRRGEETPRPLVGTVIIPAHNEAGVIGRGLRRLYDGDLPIGVEVIVVANGCTDRTVEIARSAAPQAIVLEIDAASKPAALQAGDAVATSPVRIYLDADVQMSGRAIRDTLHALADGAVAARPHARYDTTGASRLVVRYFRARESLPSLNRHAWGAGVYALSAEARARFDSFPDFVGDDLWVDQHLAPGELVLVPTDPVVVTTPRNSRNLLRTLRRAQKGKQEVPEGTPHQVETESEAWSDLRRLAASGAAGSIDAAVYAAFAGLSRLRRQGRGHHWERDESSR